MANRPIQLLVLLVVAMLPAAPTLAAPDTVFFPSADGATEIVAYLFKPQTPGPHPTVVMLHGRGGPYSSNVNKGCALVNQSVQGNRAALDDVSKRAIALVEGLTK